MQGVIKGVDEQEKTGWEVLSGTILRGEANGECFLDAAPPRRSVEKLSAEFGANGRVNCC